MYAFFLLIMSYFWKTVSGRKWPIIQTRSLWQSRCAFIYYNSISTERELSSLFPGEKSRECCIWHIYNGIILQNVAHSNWVLYLCKCVYRELISKWCEKWGEFPLLHMCSPEGMENLMWCPLRYHRGRLGMECLQSQKTHSLCLLYCSGFLLFCIATWLSGIVLFRFYIQASDWVWTLGSPAGRLLGVLRTACGAAQAHGQVHLWRN